MKTGSTCRLFDLFHPSRHTVLVLDPALQESAFAAISSYPKDVIRMAVVFPKSVKVQAIDEGMAFCDSEGHTHRAYSTELGTKVVIVRPEGVVGALLRSTEDIAKYFSRIFVI